MRAVAVVAALAPFVMFGPARAQESIKEARDKRDAARNAAAAAAAEIDELKAADADLAAALNTINKAVAAQQARVDAAERAVQAFEEQAAQRQAEVSETEIAIEKHRQRVVALLVEDYMGQSLDQAQTVLRVGSVNEALVRTAFLRAVQTDTAELAGQLRALEYDRQRALAEANGAVRSAEEAKAAKQAELDALATQKVAQERVRKALEARIADWRRREDALERESNQMSAFIRAEQAKVLGVANTPLASSVQGFVTPVKGRLVSGFGMRKHPIYGDVRLHAGADFDAKTGDAVFAAKEGRVIFAGERGGYGNCVIVQHGTSAVTTIYAHLSSYSVRNGNFVGKGELIGRVGSTGLSTGPHLHFEVRINGDAKDPMLFLP